MPLGRLVWSESFSSMNLGWIAQIFAGEAAVEVGETLAERMGGAKSSSDKKED